MEDNNVEININKINNNQEQQQMSFSEYFYNQIDLMPILDESIKKIKLFISYIIAQLEKVLDNKKDKQPLFLADNIFKFMINNYEKLGIKFFYSLVNEENFKTILINLFLDDIKKKEIKELLQKIIYIFNFEFRAREINHPLYTFYYDCINFGIIEQSDLKEKEARDSLTEEEKLFLELVSLKNIWETYRKKGIEKNAESFLEKLLSDSENHLIDIIGADVPILSEAGIEYYQERIYEINEYKKGKNKNIVQKEKQINKNKINNKEINIAEALEFYENDEDEFEYDDDDLKTAEQIKVEIKELRKKPLKDRTYFYIDEAISKDEDEYIEYKDYFFPLDWEKEKELKRQFCAFLNTYGGRLYIGINDEKKVVGVYTNEKLSHYEDFILKLTNNFMPKMEPKDYFKLYAIPIKNNKNGKIIDNLFVFKIVIKRGDPTELYYDQNNYGLNVSTRQAGQCPNLKASEIKELILERNNMKQLKGNQINIKGIIDMNDPEPYINQRIKNNENMKDNWRIPRKDVYKAKKNVEKNNINNKNLQPNYNNKKNDNNINNNPQSNYNQRNNNTDNNNNYNNNNNIDEVENIVGLKNKKNKKKKKGHNNNFKGKTKIRVEIYNLEKNIDEKNMFEFFEGFNPKDKSFYKNQDGFKNGYLDFENEEDANKFISAINGFAFGSKNVSFKKVYL